MRSVIFGAIITAFLASAGTVQAGNDLDGKSLFCKAKDETSYFPVYGLVFDQGKVTRWHLNGYFKIKADQDKSDHVRGTRYISWSTRRHNPLLNRHTLKINGNDQCEITTSTELQKTLDNLIEVAKRANKI